MIVDLNAPAFPQSMKAEGPFGGLTMRDWFAGQALPAVIAATSAGQHNPRRDAGEVGILSSMALDAYDIADAMLAARSTSPNTDERTGK